MWMLACPQNLFWRGMMSSKDPKIILTVKIFADKQTKFRCQTSLTCLWVYWGNSQLQIVPLLSLISVIKSQSRVSVHCSAIKQHSLFIDNSLLLPPVRPGTLESEIQCSNFSWPPPWLTLVSSAILTSTFYDAGKSNSLFAFFNPILGHLVTEGRWLLLLKVYNVKLEWSFQFPWVTIFLGYW